MALSERQAGDGGHKSAEQARQGMTTHHVRWVLAISLVLGIVTLSCAWIGYAVINSQTMPPTVEARP
jgi:ABC-type Fe3+-siderophore transport system permease subunit